MRRVRPLVTLTFALALGACDAWLMRATGELPFFPTLPNDNVSLLARTSGTLVLESGCLWLRSTQERHLIVWPSGWSVERRAGELTVVDDSGNVQARVGDDVEVGGGELRRSEAQPAGVDLQVEARIGQAVPPSCREGLYWLGGIIGSDG